MTKNVALDELYHPAEFGVFSLSRYVMPAVNLNFMTPWQPKFKGQ